MASPGVFSDPDPKAWVVGKDLGAFWGPWDETPSRTRIKAAQEGVARSGRGEWASRSPK